MSAYLARLKQLENEKNSLNVPNTEPPKPAKVPFDPFGGEHPAHIEKTPIAAESLLAPQQEARREKVIAMLDADPAINRAVHADTDSDPHNVILTIAIRHVATCEMLVPKARFDAWQLLALVDGAGADHVH